MQTTDFTGSYDYEREEAQYVAQTMIDDAESGYQAITPELIAKELAHWQKCLCQQGYLDFKDELEKQLSAMASGEITYIGNTFTA